MEKHVLLIQKTFEMKQYLLLIFPFLVWSCQENKNIQLNKEESKQVQQIDYLALGDKYTKQAQDVLIMNVSQAIMAGGTPHAIDFCYIEAMPLTDSISKMNGVKIQRLTDKSRNKENKITKPIDNEVWETFKSGVEQSIVRKEINETYYYKPIKLGMDTCLKCHGSTTEHLTQETLHMLDIKYPEDLARNYELGDLRAMWKVTFKD